MINPNWSAADTRIYELMEEIQRYGKYGLIYSRNGRKIYLSYTPKGFIFGHTVSVGHGKKAFIAFLEQKLRRLADADDS